VKKATNAAHAFALTLVDEFARCGVVHACLAPGSRSTPLALALAEHEGLQLHMRVDERSASFLAVGIAKSTGAPAVVLSTSGTAAANFFPAIIEAGHSRTPMIVVTADRPPELRATGANQTIDQIKMYGDAVRWFCEIGAPEPIEAANKYWRSVAARAVAEATSSPGGPVHLNAAVREPLVPGDDEWQWPIEGRPEGRPWHTVERGSRDARPEALSHLARRIEATERGVIVAGDGAGAPHALARLAEQVGYPLIAEPTSGLRSGTAAISTYDALLRVESFAEEHRPDLVLRVGKPATSKVLGPWLAGADQVLLDPGGAPLDPDRSVELVIDADPDRTAATIAKAVPGKSDSAWNESWRRAEARARSVIDRLLDSRDEPTEPRIARDVARSMPVGSVLVVASSMPVRDLDWFMAPHADLTVIGNRGASGIDGFVSTAIGAALGSDREVTALAGDLSMIHDSNGLGISGEPAPDTIFVVVNNDGGGIFSFLPQARHVDHFETLFGTPHGLDFARLAALYDCGYALVRSATELPTAIEAARKQGGIQLVETRTERAANVTIHEEIWDAVRTAVEELD
jgi:2-succinyl-5-enolpyruvyl-6-hydroxy-3-cyclohexene-1-carboxylate synthase